MQVYQHLRNFSNVITFIQLNIHATMVNENLLATYSLLSFIRESYGEDSKESLLTVFVPLVKVALVRN